MSFNNSNLLDREFLNKLAYEQEKEIFVKIISYDNKGNPQSTLEGLATGGSINIDGNSSVRRSCSLSFVSDKTDNNTFFDFYWSLTTQFELFIGLKNTVTYEPNIIWFPMGQFIISSFSQVEQLTSTVFNISGKDKMARLNGDMGGLFTALSTDLGTKMNKEGIIEKISLKQIIQNLLTIYGGEYHHNVIINDLDDELGLELLEYRGDSPLYLFEAINTHQIDNYTIAESTQCQIVGETGIVYINNPAIIYKKLTAYPQHIVDNNKNPTEVYQLSSDGKATNTKYYIIQVEYGEQVGYKLTNGNGKLVYAGDLIAHCGESVTSILDKIVQMLGNYEYFYNRDGQFVFQKKPNISTITMPKSFALNGENTNLIFDVADFENLTVFDFCNDELNISKNQTYKINNIKNDFAVWGKQNQRDIYLRYAIDQKPQYYKSYNGISYISQLSDNKKHYVAQEGEYIIYASNTKDVAITKELNDSYTYTLNDFKFEEDIIICDWREILYRMAYDYVEYGNRDDFYAVLQENNPELVAFGLTSYEKYYTDIFSFWRELYDPEPKPNYSRISYEEAKTDININQIYVDSLIKYTELTGEEKQNISRDQLYTIINKVELVKWIDTVDFEDKFDLQNLYYYKNSKLTPLIDYIDLTTEKAYIYVNNQWISLFDTLTSEQKDRVYISNSIYSTTKQKYTGYYNLSDYIDNTEMYNINNNKLYALLKLEDNTVKQVEVNNIQYILNEDEQPYLWIYDYSTSSIPLEQLKMIQEAFISHRSKIKMYLNYYGERAGIDNIIGLQIEATKNLTDEILWYYDGNEYYFLNEYFLHDGTDDNKDDKYNVYNSGLMRLNANKEENIYRILDLIDIDKSKIYIVVNGIAQRAIDVLDIDISDSNNIYWYSEDVKHALKTVDHSLTDIYQSSNELQEFFYSAQYTLNGVKSTYKLDMTKTKIKYYTRSFDYNLPNGKDWTNCWNIAIQGNFNKAKFWFDFLDSQNMARYSVATLGDRNKTIENAQITGFDYGNIPDILFISNMNNEKPGFKSIIMTNDNINKLFMQSGQGRSALSVVEENIDNLLKNNSSIAISSLPIYWLDANEQIIINNTEFQKQYYSIARITIPLTYNGKMSMELIALE